ncbi:unnamed protein product, partial [Brenthis ino]
MGRGKPVCEELRKRIVCGVDAGKSSYQISKDLILPRSTVQSIIQHYKKNRTTSCLKKTGRPRITSAVENRILKKIIKKNRRARAAELTVQWKDMIHKDVSVDTCKRVLKRMGYGFYTDKEKPLLTAIQKKKRHYWKQKFKAAHEDLTLEDRSRSGRPAEWGIEVTREAVENQPSTSTRQLSDSLGPSKDAIYPHLKSLGHRSYHCPTTPKPPKSPITNCTFCKKPGHSENDCFAKARSGPHKQNVNLCSERVGDAVNNDITTAVVQDIPVDVLIDSGVINISLISSDALKYFSCNAKPTNCALKGLSNQEIVARSYVNLTFEFSEIAIEADLVVVPSNCISFPIIIGTDILNREGITYLRTKDKQCLTRSINVVSNADVNRATNEIKINTPLFGEELNP